MKRQLLYVLLLMPILFASCVKENPSDRDEDRGSYMQLNTRAGEDAGSNRPCFIFWRDLDYYSGTFLTSDMTPYVYKLPGGVIDDYNATLSKPKYNTGRIYPPYAEPVYAVGVSPVYASGVSPISIPGDAPGSWMTLAVNPAMAGLVDIQCARVIAGSEQSHFFNPLVFAHQLARLEFNGYCGESMWDEDDADKFIDVKDIKISISSDVDNQWKWFPEKLTWSHGGIGVGQYEVISYTGKPATIVAKVSSADPSPGITLLGKEDIGETKSKPIGNFYLVPEFDKITVKIEATYVDTTDDGKIEILRTWDVVVPDIAGSSNFTEAGKSYTINIGFERSRIILGVTVEKWPDDIHN